MDDKNDLFLKNCLRGCVQVQTAQAAQISSGKKCAFYGRLNQEKLLLFFAKNDIITIIKGCFS